MKKTISLNEEDANWLVKNSISLSKYIRKKINEDRLKQLGLHLEKLPPMKKCIKGHPDFSGLLDICPNCAAETVKMAKTLSEGI